MECIQWTRHWAQNFTYIVSSPCDNIHTLQIKKHMQRGSHLPRVHTADSTAQPGFKPGTLSPKPLLFPLHQVGSWAPELERRGEETLHKLGGIPFRLSSRDQSAKPSGSGYSMTHGSLSILDAVVVHRQGEKLGRECYNGLLEILRKWAPAAHTPNFTRPVQNQPPTLQLERTPR